MARFTQAQPNINQGREVSAQGLAKGIYQFAQNKQIERARRQEYAKQFDVARMEIEGKGQQILDNKYKDVIDASHAIQQAAVTYGIGSEQENALRDVYNSTKQDYILSKQTAESFSNLYKVGEEYTNQNALADQSVYKGVLWENLRNKLGDFEKGLVSDSDLFKHAVNVTPEQANLIVSEDNMRSAILGIVDEMQEESSVYYSKARGDNGYTVTSNEFKYLKYFTELKGGVPKRDAQGDIVYSLNDNKVDRLLADIDKQGVAKQSFDYSYEQNAEEGESRADYFTRLFGLEDAVQGIRTQYKKEDQPFPAGEMAMATSTDYERIINDSRQVVGAVQDALKSNNPEFVQQANQKLASLSGFTTDDGTKVNSMRLMPAQEVSVPDKAEEFYKFARKSGNRKLIEEIVDRDNKNKGQRLTIDDVLDDLEEGKFTNVNIEKDLIEAYKNELSKEPEYRSRVEVSYINKNGYNDVKYIFVDEKDAAENLSQYIFNSYSENSDKKKYDVQGFQETWDVIKERNRENQKPTNKKKALP